MLEKSGKSGGMNPRRAQTDREETPDPHDRLTIDHRRTTDTRPTTELHDEITLEQILERQSSMHNHNTTTVHNRFNELQSDDSDEDEDEHEDGFELDELACDTTQAGRTFNKRNLNKRQRTVNDDDIDAIIGDNDDEHEQEEPTRDEIALETVIEENWHVIDHDTTDHNNYNNHNKTIKSN